MAGTPYDGRWRKARAVVLERDGFRCQLQMVGCTGHANQVDHIVPLSEGGARLDPHNLRASCAHCNLSRNGSRAGQLAAALGATGRIEHSREW